MLAAERIAERYYPYIGETIDEPGEEFNIDATPYDIDREVHYFDTPAEMIDALRRDGVEFAATGRIDYAAEPDGAHVIDYGTGASERVSWHFFPTMPLATHLFVVALVDRQVKRFERYPSGQIRRPIEALPAHHFMRDAARRRQAERFTQ